MTLEVPVKVAHFVQDLWLNLVRNGWLNLVRNHWLSLGQNSQMALQWAVAHGLFYRFSISCLISSCAFLDSLKYNSIQT